MFAIIETGSKQYKVSAGDKIRVEKLSPKGDAVSFDKVLLVSDGGDKTTLGKPFIKGATVEGKVVKNARNRKVIVFKYHSKTRYRKKKGHRQDYTEIEITKITA